MRLRALSPLFAAVSASAQIRLANPGLSQDARFGAAVLIRDGIVYLGAPGTTVSGNASAGIVYVYDAGTGAELGFVRRSSSEANDRFGVSIVAGSRLFIGAPGRQGPEYGSVFYKSHPAKGSRYAEYSFYAPVAASNSGFGSAIAASDDGAIVVGAPDGPGGTEAGAAYFFNGFEDPPDL